MIKVILLVCVIIGIIANPCDPPPPKAIAPPFVTPAPIVGGAQIFSLLDNVSQDSKMLCPDHVCVMPCKQCSRKTYFGLDDKNLIVTPRLKNRMVQVHQQVCGSFSPKIGPLLKKYGYLYDGKKIVTGSMGPILRKFMREEFLRVCRSLLKLDKHHSGRSPIIKYFFGYASAKGADQKEMDNFRKSAVRFFKFAVDKFHEYEHDCNCLSIFHQVRDQMEAVDFNTILVRLHSRCKVKCDKLAREAGKKASKSVKSRSGRPHRGSRSGSAKKPTRKSSRKVLKRPKSTRAKSPSKARPKIIPRSPVKKIVHAAQIYSRYTKERKLSAQIHRSTKKSAPKRRKNTLEVKRCNIQQDIKIEVSMIRKIIDRFGNGHKLVENLSNLSKKSYVRTFATDLANLIDGKSTKIPRLSRNEEDQLNKLIVSKLGKFGDDVSSVCQGTQSYLEDLIKKDQDVLKRHQVAQKQTKLHQKVNKMVHLVKITITVHQECCKRGASCCTSKMSGSEALKKKVVKMARRTGEMVKGTYRTSKRSHPWKRIHNNAKKLHSRVLSLYASL